MAKTERQRRRHGRGPWCLSFVGGERPNEPVRFIAVPPQGQCPKCDGEVTHVGRCSFERALLRGNGAGGKRKRRHGRPRGR